MSRAFSPVSLALLGLGLLAPACHSSSDGGATAGSASSSAVAPPPSAAAAVTTTILTPGTGPVAKPGDKVAVHYVGTLLDGTKFASSRDKNEPLLFTVGQRGIVKGMNQGVVGMHVGETRRIVVPPSLAYGERSSDKIPPNSTLTYEVELLGIETK
ncbi:MAG TPA: FKBP-type peptidyl-prolyl cis-trans isomerase [Polyangiaceae bacterium]|nr:FKBP-type peptidyl-prolyl cis-trans isomerase [Polyangiaceae bacterium]